MKNKNILAENMLRFGVKNLLESNKIILTKLVEQQTQAPSGTKIKYTGLMTFAKPGDSNPAGYIQSLMNGIMKAIYADPNTKNMIESQSMKLVGADIRGGSSNSWSGKQTSFDRELNGAVVQPVKDELYQKNKDLARLRAEECEKVLLQQLTKKGIILGKNLVVITNGSVYNTGGKLDPKGQNIQVNLTFSYLQTSDISNYTQIKSKFIAHGGYTTPLGKSPTGNSLAVTDSGLFKLATKNLTPEMKNDQNRFFAFEVKWNPDVLKDPYKKPWYRWFFIYNSQGKIERIQGVVYDRTLNQQLAGFFKNNSNIAPNDPVLIYMMSLVSPDYYNKRVKPYI